MDSSRTSRSVYPLSPMAVIRVCITVNRNSTKLSRYAAAKSYPVSLNYVTFVFTPHPPVRLAIQVRLTCYSLLSSASQVRVAVSNWSLLLPSPLTVSSCRSSAERDCRWVRGSAGSAPVHALCRRCYDVNISCPGLGANAISAVSWGNI